MTTPAYDLADVRRLSAAVTDSDAAAADPTGLSFTLQPPDGVTVTYVYGTDAELVKDSVGNYHVDITLSQPGRWAYKFNATGSNAQMTSGELFVRRDSTA